jgi:hypothetical protein
MRPKINWGRVGASLVNWVVAGNLAAIAPEKYKPAAVALAALIQALIPSILHPAPTAGDGSGQ